MKVKIIESNWEAYRRLVVPKDAGSPQIDEAKKAFYAGAATLMEAVLTLLSPGDEPTDSDLVMMDSIQRELDDFAMGIVNGPLQ
jgi:hypothetical protein